MAQRSKSFRFRIPWLSVPSESFARRKREKFPPHSDTSVPIHRPPKPSVIAPSSEQEKEKMVLSESQPQEVKVESPLEAISKSPETSFQPEGISTQPADTEQVSSVPSSSLVPKTEPTHATSHLASKDIKTEYTTLHEEKEKTAVSVPQEAKPKIKSPLKTFLKSSETSSQHENLSTKPTLIEQRSTQPKSKSLQPEEKEKAVYETTEARGKGKDTTTNTGQPSEERTMASASGIATTNTKESFAKAFRGDKKHPDVRETVERDIMFASTNPIGKDTRIVSSKDEVTRNVSSSSTSPEKTASSSDEKDPPLQKGIRDDITSTSPEKTASSSDEKDPPLQKGIRDDITKFVHKITASVHPTQPVDDKQFSVITLAGDNRGATMHLGSESAKKEGSIHIHRAYKSDPEETNEVTTDGEENINQEDEEVGIAYVNSNIQSINNSLMFHGSITERDPGVQVTLPQKPTEPIRLDGKPKPGLETQRTQFHISRAEKSTYQPTVRRGIRGPFLEPNDKPGLYGCKFSCDKDIEDIEIL